MHSTQTYINTVTFADYTNTYTNEWRVNCLLYVQVVGINTIYLNCEHIETSLRASRQLCIYISIYIQRAQCTVILLPVSIVIYTAVTQGQQTNRRPCGTCTIVHIDNSVAVHVFGATNKTAFHSFTVRWCVRILPFTRENVK